MKRISTSLVLIGFILWILPLGYFIKPFQEKIACDGQRAMCMCHAFIPKVPDKAMEPGIVLKAGASTNKENSSGGGNYFVTANPVLALHLPLAPGFENQYLSYKSPFLAALEYVPKI